LGDADTHVIGNAVFGACLRGAPDDPGPHWAAAWTAANRRVDQQPRRRKNPELGRCWTGLHGRATVLDGRAGWGVRPASCHTTLAQAWS